MKLRAIASFAFIAAASLASYAATAAPDDDHTEATIHTLGSVTIKSYTLAASQIGKVEAGKEATFNFALTKPDGTAEPTAIRVWIGIADAKGSVKAKTHKHDDRIEVHVETPDPIPADSKLWVEVEAAGEKTSASIAYKA